MAVSDYGPIFDSAGAEWNVDPTLLKAMATQESGGNPKAVSKANAGGVMQIIPSTAAALGMTDPTDPVQSIYGGAKYMSQALDAEKTPEDALRYYHGGPNWRNAYGPESAGYAPAVTAHYQKLASATQPTPPIQPSAPATGSPPPVASTPSDPDEAAGAALIAAMAPGAAKAAPAPSDPDEAAGQALIHGIAAQAPPPAPPASPPANTTGAADTIAPGLRAALAPAPNTTYGNVLPLARDNTTGAMRLALPSSLRDLAQGGLDLAEGPMTGTVTPAGTNALFAAMVGGDVAPSLVAKTSEAAPGFVGAGVNRLLAGRDGVSPPIADLAQAARDKYGIKITGPQMSQNSLVRTVDDQSSKLPFSGAGPARAAQDSAFQVALDKEVGGAGSATPAAPKVMGDNATRIGNGLDAIAARTNIDTNKDPQLLSDLADIESRAHSGQVPLAQGGLQSIDANIAGVTNSAASGNGIIPGKVYQQMTQTGSALDKASGAGDVHTQGYNQEIMDALDRAHQRAASPEDQADLSKLRYQYRGLKTLEPLAMKSTDGTIPPASLMTSVNSQSRRFDPSTGGVAYTGGGNWGELGRIGKQFLSTPPNSGSADRILANSLIGLGSGGIGTAVATGVANPLSLAAIPAGLMANRLGGSYLRSGGLANRLIGAATRPPAPPPSLLQRLAPPAGLTPNLLGTSQQN